MAADTPLKRYSAINVSSPWRGLNVVPQPSNFAGERAAVMFLYALADAPSGGFSGNEKTFFGEIQWGMTYNANSSTGMN